MVEKTDVKELLGIINKKFQELKDGDRWEHLMNFILFMFLSTVESKEDELNSLLEEHGWDHDSFNEASEKTMEDLFPEMDKI